MISVYVLVLVLWVTLLLRIQTSTPLQILWRVHAMDRITYIYILQLQFQRSPQPKLSWECVHRSELTSYYPDESLMTVISSHNALQFGTAQAMHAASLKQARPSQLMNE
jgi:endonuclease/exonuclease/phosphatase (EEP) superfamily protein YafD